MAAGDTLVAQSAKPAARTAAPQSIEHLSRELLALMVSHNTTASTGATTPLATALAARFRAAGFPASDVHVVGASARNRNLVVIWRGRTRARPIVVNAHLDVVEAPRLDWGSDPFRLTERHGYLYGRGVLDDKGPAATIAAALLTLRRAGMVPQQDIVLTLTAGEESGIDNGVEWLLKNRPDWMRGEFALVLDGGGASMDGGRPVSFDVQSAEKMYMDVELVARGVGGHSSVPTGSTPIDAMARALDRLSRHSFPVRVNPVVRMYLERAGATRQDELGSAMRALAAEPGDLLSQSILLRDATFNAMLRTTCVATVINGGTAPNAIPQEVRTNVNCRLLPGTSPADVVTTLQRVVSDTTIEVRVSSPAVESDPSVPTDAFLEMIERVVHARYPGTPVVPYMETGATDALYLRNAGIPTFGVWGLFVPTEDAARMHGRDERISIGALNEMAQYSERLLRELAARGWDRRSD